MVTSQGINALITATKAPLWVTEQVMKDFMSCT